MITTGNELNGEEIADFSKQLDVMAWSLGGVCRQLIGTIMFLSRGHV